MTKSDAFWMILMTIVIVNSQFRIDRIERTLRREEK